VRDRFIHRSRRFVAASQPFVESGLAPPGGERYVAAMETPQRQKSWWAFISIVLGAGWAAYGILDGGKLFLAAMVAATMILGGGMAVLGRRKH